MRGEYRDDRTCKAGPSLDLVGNINTQLDVMLYTPSQGLFPHQTNKPILIDQLRLIVVEMQVQLLERYKTEHDT